MRYLFFDGLPFKIYCEFEDDYLVHISINGYGILSDLLKKYVLNTTHSFFYELKEYFNGKRKVFEQKFKFKVGTVFERKVWEEILKIKYGKIRTYKEVALMIGHDKAYRAVGNALCKNPLPIIVPCHRVISSSGKIGGFSGGVTYKKILLEVEGIKL